MNIRPLGEGHIEISCSNAASGMTASPDGLIQWKALTFGHRSHTMSTSCYFREQVQHHLPMFCVFCPEDYAFHRVNLVMHAVQILPTIVPSISLGGRCQSWVLEKGVFCLYSLLHRRSSFSLVQCSQMVALRGK